MFLICLLFFSIPLLISCQDDYEDDFEDTEEYDEWITEEESDEESMENSPVAILNDIEIRYWMYQLQNLYEEEAILALDDTDYDMLVIEPGFNFSEYPYDMDFLVETLEQKPDGSDRLLLAYIDIGQAEDYRDYWGEDWIAPTKNSPGDPDFLITIDPDGWSGNYPVAYWDEEWQAIWLDDDGIIKQLAEAGFDGVYLDWVEAYDDDKVRDAALEADLNPELEMIKFIDRIRQAGSSVSADFLVVPQNAPYLLDEDPDYYVSVIDAVAMEDTWFFGEGDAEWDDRKAGDLSGGDRHSEGYTTADRIHQSQNYLSLGIPVFTIDYCIDETNADYVYRTSMQLGFIPLVTRVSLSEISETPPFIEE